jgi:hypothetical protein
VLVLMSWGVQVSEDIRRWVKADAEESTCFIISKIFCRRARHHWALSMNISPLIDTKNYIIWEQKPKSVTLCIIIDKEIR